MRKALMILPLMLGGCTTSATAPVEAAPAPAEAICKPDGLDRYLGQTATSALGAEMVKMSGASALRWVAPGMAVTMDFRQDRLTVSYDEAYKILRASCG